MSRTPSFHSSRAIVLALLSTVCGASTALADCPAGMGSTARVNCLNTALNAAVSTITAQQATIDALATELETVAETTASLASDVDDLFLAQAQSDDLFTYLTVDTSTHAIVFSGANVFVQNGTGYTEDSMNGLGNFIVGYDEDNGDIKGGSHNIVVGPYNTYQSYSGLVVGYDNALYGAYSGILAGASNTASGSFSSVSGGDYNTASGEYSTIAGGRGGEASAYLASVLSGDYNTADVTLSTVVAGSFNVSSGNWSAVLGGTENTITGSYSTLLGGQGQTVSDDYSSTPDP